MRRRIFGGSRTVAAALAAATAVLGLLATSPPAEAQQTTRMYRVGFLTAESTEARAELSRSKASDVLRKSLREIGYVEGQNLILEIRNTEGRPEQLDDFASELVRLKVDVIVAAYPAAVFSAKRATTTIPIVMVNTPDPVQLGLVQSLAHPGGNITGTTSLSVDLSIKQLELLKEAVPRASRIAVLWNPDNPWHPLVVKGLRDRHRSLGVEFQILEVRRPNDLDIAFQAMVKERARAVQVLIDPMASVLRGRLADLAIKHHLPLMGASRAYTEAGALLSYFADQTALYARAASYVDRILKGARPGDLPIEQPTKYELVVNLKTAKALGLTIPPSLSGRADHVIQ